LKKLVGGGFQHVFLSPRKFFGHDAVIDLETCFFEKIKPPTRNGTFHVRLEKRTFFQHVFHSPPEATVRPCTVGSRLGHQRCEVISWRRIPRNGGKIGTYGGLGGGFKHVFFSPLPGEVSHFD